jgi:hypothetical protein
MRNAARRAPGRTGVVALCGTLAGLALTAVPTPAGAEPGPNATGDSVTVDRIGFVSHNGDVTLTGTYRCDNDGTGDTVFVSASLRQHGESTSVGGTTAECDGRLHRWINDDQQHWTTFTKGPAFVQGTLMRLSTRSGIPLPSFLAEHGREVTLIER